MLFLLMFAELRVEAAFGTNSSNSKFFTVTLVSFRLLLAYVNKLKVDVCNLKILAD